MSSKLNRILTIVLLAAAALTTSDCKRSSTPTDAQVASDIQGKLYADQAVGSKQIAVLAANGVVTLSGSVGSEAERSAVAADAASVNGVRTVVNNLTVQSSEAPAAQNEAPAADASQPASPAQTQPPAAPSATPSATAARRASSHKPRATKQTEASQAYRRENPPSSQADAIAQQSVAAEKAPNPLPAPAPAPPQPPAQITIPDGTALAVRMLDSLDSETANPGDTFRATLNSPIVVDGSVVVPADADLFGRVVDAQAAGRFKGAALLTIEITRISFNGRTYPLQTAQWSKQTQGRGKNTAEKVGGGAGLGAIIGAIAGGGKGAGIGAAVGAGAGGVTQAATHAKQITLGPESLLTFHLARSLTVQPSNINDRNAGRHPLN
jgi:BON domain